MLWPTPTVCGNNNRKGASKTSGDGLATVARRFPTPNARDFKGAPGAGTMANGGRHSSLPGTIKATDGRGRLNPEFVEWLMGWPTGSTALQPLAMDRFREWLRQHGGC